MMRFFLPLCSLLTASCAFANIRLPAILSNNMVLQQNSSVRLWGWGDANEKVLITTSWNNKLDSTLVDGNGKWQLAVQTPAAGGPYTVNIKGNNSIVLENILVGEVWICSGQSNMEMNFYWGLPQMKEDIPTALNENIRFFHIPKITAETPQQQGEGHWVVCDSNTVKYFSAVAFYFGRKLNAELNIPVGLVHASWGGTPAEAWTPSEVVTKDTVLSQAAKHLNPSKYWPTEPGLAFNAMLAPVTRFSIAGAIWYQGESNTGTAATYQRLLTSMISSWRSNWNKDIPFYLVQLAPYNYGDNLIGAELREAQSQVLQLPGTGMVVTTDLADDTTDIHPRNKRDVGYRLANIALLKTYNKPVVGAVSPSFKDLRISKDQVYLEFENAESGFISGGKKIEGFFIAGADRIFYPAEARFGNGTIIVRSRNVKSPVAVRYAFSNTAGGNVFSKENLPLAPFRTHF